MILKIKYVEYKNKSIKDTRSAAIVEHMGFIKREIEYEDKVVTEKYVELNSMDSISWRVGVEHFKDYKEYGQFLIDCQETLEAEANEGE